MPCRRFTNFTPRYGQSILFADGDRSAYRIYDQGQRSHAPRRAGDVAGPRIGEKPYSAKKSVAKPK